MTITDDRYRSTENVLPCITKWPFDKKVTFAVENSRPNAKRRKMTPNCATVSTYKQTKQKYSVTINRSSSVHCTSEHHSMNVTVIRYATISWTTNPQMVKFTQRRTEGGGKGCSKTKLPLFKMFQDQLKFSHTQLNTVQIIKGKHFSIGRDIPKIKIKFQKKHLTCTISLTNLKPPGPIIEPASK